MISADAPFFSEVAKGPSGGRAYWVNTEDNKKIRLGVWESGNKGTIVIFPGRAEYIENLGQLLRVWRKEVTQQSRLIGEVKA